MDLRSEAEVERALRLNRDYMGMQYFTLFDKYTTVKKSLSCVFCFGSTSTANNTCSCAIHYLCKLTGGRYIEVFRANNFKNKMPAKESKKERNFVRELRDDEEEEDVAESGRLFIRNLPYTCTEEDLKEVFIKHGECWRSDTYHFAIHV